MGEGGLAQEAWISFFRERVSSISLGFLTIRPSAVFGTRRKTALRGEGFAWVLDLRSLDKLLKVGFLPTWVLVPLLNTLQMFELNEAVRGRLIDPKTWDRIVWIYETQIYSL